MCYCRQYDKYEVCYPSVDFALRTILASAQAARNRLRSYFQKILTEGRTNDFDFSSFFENLNGYPISDSNHHCL